MLTHTLYPSLSLIAGTSLRAWGRVLKEERFLLARYTGLDEHASPRFMAFFLTGRVDTWIEKIFRRLGLDVDSFVNWDEFREGGRAIAEGSSVAPSFHE